MQAIDPVDHRLEAVLLRAAGRWMAQVEVAVAA